MAEITVTFNDHGLSKRLRETNVRQLVEVTMQKATAMVVDTAGDYPSPPPGSTYRRTGTLGRSIASEVKSLEGEVQGIVGTAVRYAPFVKDEKRQSKVHAGRWNTLQKDVEVNLSDIESLFEKVAADVAATIDG